MKLRYKFFIAFLITSFLIVFSLVGILQIFVYKNFTEFVNRQELEKLDELVSALAENYKKNSGWSYLIEDHWIWRNILNQTLTKSENFRRAQSPRPHPPRHQREEFMPPGPNGRPDDHERPGPGQNHPGPIAQQNFDPLQVKIRLSLFDKDSGFIVGPHRPEDKVLYRKIELNGKIIGWLGLKVIEQTTNPLGVEFLSAQKKTFYIFGFGIFILSGFISYILSRHLVSPIQEIMKGTRDMSSFDFNTKIHVTSKDELGTLASDFNRMAKTLKNYEEMRKNWISDISHELRTPVSILKGKIEAYQDGIRIITPEALDSLHNDIIRLEKLVEGLHFLSISDSNNILIKKIKINPMEIINERLDSFQVQLEKQSIEVQTDYSKKNVSLFASKEQLERLFSNLIENSLRYTDSPGKIEISHKINETILTIYFEDSSPGVLNESLDLIFNRLYRCEKSRSRELGGSGLGLSICKQIVENHNGTIRSDHSRLGGLKLIIELPLC